MIAFNRNFMVRQVQTAPSQLKGGMHDGTADHEYEGAGPTEGDSHGVSGDTHLARSG